MSAELSTDIGRVVIGIGGVKALAGSGGHIITHALGSCLGVTIYDPVAKVGGMLHAQLPNAEQDPERAKREPGIYVDLGIATLFRAAYAVGGQKERMRVCVSGCAAIGVMAGNDIFAIGKRNQATMRKVFWQNKVMVAGDDTGGHKPRTLILDFRTGETFVDSEGTRYRI